MLYNYIMEMTLKDYATAELSHSGRQMLGGMSVKPSIDISSYKGKVTVVPARKTKAHGLRSKSHSFWGAKS